MSDKEELRSILLDLLQVGLLRIRVWGWNGRVEECAAEADRLHDVPDMIREMDVETIRRFYDFELRHFAENTATRGFYEADWKRLGVVLDKMQSRGKKESNIHRNVQKAACSLWGIDFSGPPDLDWLWDIWEMNGSEPI